MAEPSNGNWPLATVIGGSGFVGRHLVRALAKREWRVRVACRRPERAGFLQPLGRVGQIQAVQANLRYPESVAAAVRGADAVINLVGVLRDAGAQSFEALHDTGARCVADAARAAGAKTFIHMSAIGADAHAPSAYARTKAAGEASVREAFPGAAIMRPSIIFGPEDSFFNRFGAMSAFCPALPLIGGGATRFQPVFVNDVAEAFARILDGKGAAGAAYELGGPQVAAFRELLEFICKTTYRRRPLVNLPWGGASALAALIEPVAGLGVLPAWAVLTRDQITSLKVDNVVSSEAIAQGRTLQGLGIDPEPFESIVPTYLWRFRKTGQYDTRAA